MSFFNIRISKIIFISLNIFLLLNISPVSSKLTKIKKNPGSFGKQIQNISNKNLENILIKNDIRLDYVINYLIAKDINSKKNDPFFLDIESDKQYRENDIYYAEGKVIIRLQNGTLRANKFSYDKANSKVELKGNISFKNLNEGLLCIKKKNTNKALVVGKEELHLFEEQLQKLLFDLLDAQKPFIQTTKLSTCDLCDFKGLCGR